MQIILDKKESEKLFHGALCDGMHYIGGYGLEFDYEEADYKKAKKSLQKKIDEGKTPEDVSVFGTEKPEICRENVWMEILRNGGKLKLIDVEGEGDNTREITLADVHERVQKTPLNHLQDAIDESGDADTGDVIIQTVFFEEIIFG